MRRSQSVVNRDTIGACISSTTITICCVRTFTPLRTLYLRTKRTGPRFILNTHFDQSSFRSFAFFSNRHVLFWWTFISSFIILFHFRAFLESNAFFVVLGLFSMIASALSTSSVFAYFLTLWYTCLTFPRAERQDWVICMVSGLLISTLRLLISIFPLNQKHWLNKIQPSDKSVVFESLSNSKHSSNLHLTYHLKTELLIPKLSKNCNEVKFWQCNRNHVLIWPKHKIERQELIKNTQHIANTNDPTISQLLGKGRNNHKKQRGTGNSSCQVSLEIKCNHMLFVESQFTKRNTT